VVRFEFVPQCLWEQVHAHPEYFERPEWQQRYAAWSEPTGCHPALPIPSSQWARAPFETLKLQREGGGTLTHAPPKPGDE
jgi:hypothetical protein